MSLVDRIHTSSVSFARPSSFRASETYSLTWYSISPPRGHSRPHLLKRNAAGYAMQRCGTLKSSTSPSSSSDGSREASSSLLEWLIQRHKASPSHLRVERALVGETSGFGLVATETMLPGETILSIPLQASIISAENEQALWSLSMMTDFLGALQDDSQAMQPWLSTLPKQVDLPWLHWSDEEVDELQDRDTIEEVEHLRSMSEDCLRLLNNEHEDHKIAWAASLVHSRSFIANGNVHVWVPGIDLCNHSWNPKAQVRCIHSPEAVQGIQALEDIAPIGEDQGTGLSRFEIVVGERAISKGEEVCISYGNWPNDVLLLFFGWVEEWNPYDSVAIFSDMNDVVEFYTKLIGLEEGEELFQSISLDAMRHQYACGYDRMVVTEQGLSSSLVEAVQVLVDSQAKYSYRAEHLSSVAEIVRTRCAEVLEEFPTTLQEDHEFLDSESCSVGRMRTAVQYRAGKKRILLTVLEKLQSA